MWKKCKIEDLKIGLPVREYPDQSYSDFVIKELTSDGVVYGCKSDGFNMIIPFKKLGSEFYELWFDDYQLSLF